MPNQIWQCLNSYWTTSKCKNKKDLNHEHLIDVPLSLIRERVQESEKQIAQGALQLQWEIFREQRRFKKNISIRIEILIKTLA